jgi:hypothetical protein
MALDYQSLINRANASGYQTAGALSITRLLRLALLQTIANNSNPMAATDYQSLLNSTDVTGYRSVGAGAIADLLELSLLNIIAGGGGSVQSGAGSPVGVLTPTTGLLYFNTTDKTLWAADGTKWNQLV